MLFERKRRLSTNKKEEDTIEKIVSRFTNLIPNKYNSTLLVMDISAIHLNGTPLNLDALLQCTNADLAHDIMGITKDIDRRTGQLMGYFNPRCSKERRNESLNLKNNTKAFYL